MLHALAVGGEGGAAVETVHGAVEGLVGPARSDGSVKVLKALEAAP